MLFWFIPCDCDGILLKSAAAVVPIADLVSRELVAKGFTTFLTVFFGFSAADAEELKDRLGIKGERDELVGWVVIGTIFRIANKAGFLVATISWMVAEGSWG